MRSQRLRVQRRLRRELAQARELLQSRRTLRRRLAEAETRVEGPSFHLLTHQHRHFVDVARRTGTREHHPELQLPYKLRNLALAASHGVPVPAVVGVWDEPGDIALGDLPDGVVLKADCGAGARTVLPLRRSGRGWRTASPTRGGRGRRTLTEPQVRDVVQGWAPEARPPYFAEAQVPGPAPGALPDDVKVYCAYGRVLQIVLMRGEPCDPLRRSLFGWRLIDAAGADLGEVMHGTAYDHDIPVPEHLPGIVRDAEHLSRALGVACSRIDFFDTPQGHVFNEVTRSPGGRQRYVPEHDRALGEMWMEAQVRVEADRRRGRPPGVLFGRHPHTWHYDAVPAAAARPGPSRWAREQAACEAWCRG